MSSSSEKHILSGATAIVGAPRDDHAGYSSGSAYLFDITTGQQITKLTAADAAAYDYFGSSVAINVMLPSDPLDQLHR